MAKAPQIVPNTPEDVILRLSQRQAGVSVTQGLLETFRGSSTARGRLLPIRCAGSSWSALPI